jgi:uncharacterized coiled-coil DUF342 family protein
MLKQILDSCLALAGKIADLRAERDAANAERDAAKADLAAANAERDEAISKAQTLEAKLAELAGALDPSANG